MKRMALALLAAVAFASGSIALTTTAYAQEDKPRGRTLGRPTETRDQSGEVVRDQGGKPMDAAARATRGKAEAPAVVAKANAPCTVSDARFNGTGTKAGADGKPVTVQTYEVACSEGLGFLLEDHGATAVAYDCIVVKFAADKSIADATAAGKPAPRAPVCELPANTNLTAALQPLVQQANTTCTINNVAYVGVVPKDNVTRYEIGCAEGMGYLFDRSNVRGPAPKTISCLAVEGAYDCKFTPKANRVAFVANLARASGKPCNVSDARLMGSSRGSDFYEVACSGAEGLVIEAKGAAVTRTIPCVEAQQIGEGCKLSSTAAALEVREQAYLARLRASGVTCQGEEFRLIGKDQRNARDVVEFKCANKATGLVAFVPTAAGGNVTSFDCIEAEGRAIKCSLTTRQQIIAALNTSMAAKGCTVVNYAVLGASATDGEVLEVACAGDKTGYIVDLPTARGAPSKVLSCQQSESRGGDKCTLPENKK